ncbi:motility protein A [Bordetella sp. FB-8]|uniref:motility protein A n=1 Tax=Bordetella sp. FB-8 TaxID=1159870 RepID=UPI00036C818B|nr:MotA/TolQ/ExbB proton channel family protein [Bordetella sp. FB-8]
MNLSTLIGLVLGLITLILVLVFSAINSWAYLNLPGLIIVIGGTLAALFISYPMREVLRIPHLLRAIFRSDRLPIQRDIDELSNLAQMWMNEDVHKAEEALKKVTNPFLRTGVQLIINHTPEDQIIELLQWRIARLRAREHAESQMFRTMASFAPAFGMLGTLIGLVSLMTVLGTGGMDLIGHHLSIALMATFYGLLLSNLICKPIAVKLERRTEQRVVLMNMIMQGVSMMCERRGPALVRETLNSFMLHVDDEIDDGGPAAPVVRRARRQRVPSVKVTGRS